MISRKDYILRQIDLLGILLQTLLTLKRASRIEEMKPQIIASFEEVGLNLETMEQDVESGCVDSRVLIGVMQTLRMYLSVNEDFEFRRLEQTIIQYLESRGDRTYIFPL